MTISSNNRHPEILTDTSVSHAMAKADDPCDAVEAAIPAMVIGDLTSEDINAIDQHCATCLDCAETRATWESGLAEPDWAKDSSPPDPASALGLHAGHYGLMESPVGDLLIVVTEDGVADISYLANRGREERFADLEARGILATEQSSQVEPVREQLREYFARRRSSFTLPVDLHGVTPFTRSVLDATCEIGFGQVQTYQGIASRIGKPGASRAVGNALGRNPVPMIVPCHRIVRADGSIGWYTGGAHIKEALLTIEGLTYPVSGGNQPGLPGMG